MDTTFSKNNLRVKGFFDEELTYYKDLLEKHIDKIPFFELKKGQKILRFDSGQRLIINNDINGAFESMTKEQIHIRSDTSLMPYHNHQNLPMTNLYSPPGLHIVLNHYLKSNPTNNLHNNLEYILQFDLSSNY